MTQSSILCRACRGIEELDVRGGERGAADIREVIEEDDRGEGAEMVGVSERMEGQR